MFVLAAIADRRRLLIWQAIKEHRGLPFALAGAAALVDTRRGLTTARSGSD